jgi:hypothetical protein
MTDLSPVDHFACCEDDDNEPPVWLGPVVLIAVLLIGLLIGFAIAAALIVWVAANP